MNWQNRFWCCCLCCCFCHFLFFRGLAPPPPRKIKNEKNSSRGSSIKICFANSFSLTSTCLWMLRALTSANIRITSLSLQASFLYDSFYFVSVKQISIEGRSGKLFEKNSFGNDRSPPKHSSDRRETSAKRVSNDLQFSIS